MTGPDALAAATIDGSQCVNHVVLFATIATPSALVLREAIRVWFMCWCIKHDAKPKTLMTLARLWRR